MSKYQTEKYSEYAEAYNSLAEKMEDAGLDPVLLHNLVSIILDFESTN